MKKSVPRLSKLQYCLELAKKCLEKGFLKIERRIIEGRLYEVPKDAYEVIFEYRKEEEDLRAILAHRYVSPEKRKRTTRGKYLLGIASELVATLHRWKLLYKVGNVYECSEGFRQMGRKNRQEAKRILLRKVLIHEPLFSRLLLTLRDSSLHEDHETEFGATYCNEIFMSSLDTNPVSLDVLCDWGEFFDLSYDYKIEIDHNVRRKLILTCLVATVDDILESLAAFPTVFEKATVLDMTKWPVFRMESVLHFLIRLGIIEKVGNKYHQVTGDIFNSKQLIDLAKKERVLLVEKGRQSLLIEENRVDLESFKEAVLKCYRRVLAGVDVYAPIAVSIDELRSETCRELRISREIFDRLFIKLYQQYKEYIFLVGASRAIRREVAKRQHVVSGKPLKYENQYFSFVTIVWEYIK